MPRSSSSSSGRSASRTPTWSAARCGSRRTCRSDRAAATAFGTRVEVKNMNSFRSVERAIAFEIERQAAALEAGETLTQDTRGWDDGRGVTYVMRSKEDSHDYRYFPEPDLPPLRVDRGLAGGDPGRPARAAGRPARRATPRRSACRPTTRRSSWPIRRWSAAFEAIRAAGPDLPAKEVANLVTRRLRADRQGRSPERTADGLAGARDRSRAGRPRPADRSPARSRRTNAREVLDEHVASGRPVGSIVEAPRPPPDLGRRRARADRRRGHRRQPQGGRRLPGRQADDRLPRRPGDEGDPRPGQRRRSSRRPSGSGSTTGVRRSPAGERCRPRPGASAGWCSSSIGWTRARGPWARYRELKAQDENIARYEAWRGGLRDESKTGASVAMEILRRQARVGLLIGDPRLRPRRWSGFLVR